MWDARYAADDYVYGTQPNDFLAAVVHRIPKGAVLSLAAGEGRNSVFLAAKGHPVTAVDQSAVGLEKARKLAALRGVEIETVVADLADFDIEPGAWAGIVLIFAHLPPAVRARVHAAAARGLRPGGVLVLEAYTRRQLDHGTGGPPREELLFGLEELQAELAGLRLLHAVEVERDVHEGSLHAGRAAVVQVLARRD